MSYPTSKASQLKLAPAPSLQSPTVSVVIATHNRPALLKVALEQVLAQDYAGTIECIVVFDKMAPDFSLESGDTARPVRVVHNARKPGLAGARNTGILAASGEYVGFCDDDDEWSPTKVTAQVSALQGSDALTSVTGITVLYEDHEIARVPRQSDLTLEQLVRRRVMEAHPSSVMVRHDALLGQIGLIDEDIPGSYGEDFDWIIRAIQSGPIIVVEKPMVRVRWGQSLFSQKWQTIIDAIDYGLAKHPVFHQDRRGLARLYGRRAFASAALGRPRDAIHGAARTVRLSWRERRAYLAVAVALRLISAERLMSWAHRRGRGI